jgi:alpha-N-arabinofuranosidase
MASLALGEATRVELSGPTVPTTKFGDVPAVDAVATVEGDTGALTVFAVNRVLARAAESELQLPAGAGTKANGRVVTHADPHATNGPDTQTVVPTPLDARVEDGRLRVTLPPVAWAAITVDRPD